MNNGVGAIIFYIVEERCGCQKLRDQENYFNLELKFEQSRKNCQTVKALIVGKQQNESMIYDSFSGEKLTTSPSNL